MDTIKNILEFELYTIGSFSAKIYNIVGIIFILIVTKIILWLIKKAIYKKRGSSKLDEGTTYAIFQIIKYVIWVIAVTLFFEVLGVKISFLLAGSAALLVGIGLGLQQTFNDIVSGIILLSERSIKINDVLEIDGDVVKISSIGLRTSKGLNRDNISLIIPNSLITTSKVINWSHQSKNTRFRILVSVARGSDVDLVIRLLEESAIEHLNLLDKNLLEVRLLGFEHASLEFELLFYSKNRFRIERIKSNIRIIINKKFVENKVVIPFAQMDLHLKSKMD